LTKRERAPTTLVDRTDKKFVKTVRPKNSKQEEYIRSIRDYPVTIGIGKAGSGKTYLAVSEATIDFDANKIGRILVLRPAAPSEEIGFLPGTLEEKMDPFLRPIFDSLIDRWGVKRVQHMIEEGTIEVASMAYIKGRTFNNCFVILDEAQDAKPEQIKLFLTRIGENCTAVLTGDPDQSEFGKQNGLSWAVEKLHNCPIVSIVKFEREHVVRSEVVKALLAFLGDD
jgi:phosphate starvation-inducible PhoH-like protein